MNKKSEGGSNHISIFALCSLHTSYRCKAPANRVSIVKCVCLHTLLHVVVCCGELLRTVWNWSNFWANYVLQQYFFCSMISRAWCNNVESVCTALPTLLAIFGLTNPSGLVGINFINQIINFIIQETVIK